VTNPEEVRTEVKEIAHTLNLRKNLLEVAMKRITQIKTGAGQQANKDLDKI